MQWPLRWLRPVETALNVYNVMTAAQRGMKLEGEALKKWKKDNKRLLQAALDIEAIRNGGQETTTTD
jgi:hypothetical protein